MSEIPPVTNPPESPEHGPEEATLPAWVPLLIGAILVAMAGLAVYTGLRYRNNTLVSIVKPRRQVPHPTAAAPPGEPEAGASLIFPGSSGDNAPAARPPVSGSSRAIVTGTGGAIDATVRIWARRGMQLTVTPDDAVVYVNDVAVGQAKQFNTSDEIYDFPAAGSYNVRLVAPGYKDRAFVVTATDSAKSEIARINTKLEKQ